MKRKVIAAFFKDTVTASPAFGGETTLNAEKHEDIEMYTGIEPGFLTVLHPALLNKEVGIPLSNCKNIVWEKEDANRVDRDRKA